MKVAIIGAGVSGLSCALKLKQNGILPTVFEAREKVGDAICSSCISLRILTRSFHDYFYYINKKYGLELKPLHQINKIIMHSPGRSASISGKLGYTIKRGTDLLSIENQIAAKAGVDILFDKYVEISQLINVFDKIIVATGNNVIPVKLGAWSDSFNAVTRNSKVLGEFDTGTVEIWFDTRHSKNTFCYLVPLSPNEASIVLCVDGISSHEIDIYWNKFMEIEKIKYPVIEFIDAKHICGEVYPYNQGKVYFTGNAAGFTDSFIGLGIFNAIESGFLAARAIIENTDYNKLVLPISKNVAAINEYRDAVNVFENKDYDRLLSVLNLPLVKQYIYNNPFFKVSHGQNIIKALNNVFRRK
ncbi:MAG: dehydrogenase [Ruminiclostridium sp.]|nr:dehydrogenase [Ruminiclostridium sp.]